MQMSAMKNHLSTYYFPLILLLWMLPCFGVSAQSRSGHEFMLGSGGSQYSRSNDRIIGNNGLRTGQYTGTHHLIGFYLDGMYSTFMQSIPQIASVPVGSGFGGGLMYQYQRNSFVLNIGLGVRWQDVRLQVRDTAFTKYNVADSWTNQYDTLHYNLTYSFADRQDRSKSLYLQLPILAGQSFGTPSGAFYYLAGIKLSALLTGETSVRVTGTTTGEYDRYMGIFQEMDNHGLRKNVEMSREGSKLSMKADLQASFECGYEWASPERKGYRTEDAHDWRLRIGVFADLGLINVNRSKDKLLIDIPADYMYDFSEYNFNHILTTTTTIPHTAHNCFVGIKFTILYGFQAKEECVICHEFRDEQYMANPNRNR
ncbi:MAG: hypothetical protein ACI4TV_03230 [Paludibacteraceae bacterium]